MHLSTTNQRHSSPNYCFLFYLASKRSSFILFFLFYQQFSSPLHYVMRDLEPKENYTLKVSNKIYLRTVPIIVIAHKFCASRDTRISYRRCLLIQKYFCAAQKYSDKAELSKCSWYPKRKLGVTTHFSEIIKPQFAKGRHTLLCILKLFTNIVD